MIVPLPAWRRHWPWLAVSVAPLILFAPFLLGLRVLYWGTPLLQFYPWRRLAFDLLRAGQWPLWNPYLGNGAPLLANLQSAVFYPPNWLGLFLPLEYSFSWLVALHWIWAGAGMVALSRALGLKPLGQAVAGLAFGLCQYLVARAWFFSINATVAWLPWVIWAGDRAMASAGQRAVWRRYAWLLALFVAMQLLAGHAQTAWYTLLLLAAWAFWRTAQRWAGPVAEDLAGFQKPARSASADTSDPSRKERAAQKLESVMLRAQPSRARSIQSPNTSDSSRKERAQSDNFLPVGMGRAPWMTQDDKQFVGSRLWRAVCPAAALVLPLFVAGLLAALQLLPTAELLRQSPRADAAGYDFVMTYSFSPWRLLTLLAPDLLGNPARGLYYGYGNYWEDAVYAGVLPLLLAAASLWQALRLVRWRRRPGAGAEPEARRALVPLLTLVLLITLLLALGRNTPVFPFLYRHMPTFNLFQAPARMMVWFEFALALLAGLGAGQLGRLGGQARRWVLRAAVGAVSVILTGAVCLVVIPAQAPLGQQFQTVARALATLGVSLLLTFLLLLARPAGEDESAPVFRWQLLVAAFVAADLIYAGWGLNPGASPDLYRAPSATGATLRAALGDHRLFEFPDDEYLVKYSRLQSFKTFGPPQLATDTRAAEVANAGLLDGLASANNYDPLVSARYINFINVVSATSSLNLLNLMDVGVIANSQPLLLKAIATGGPLTFYRTPGEARRVRVVYAARTVPDAAAAQAAIADLTFDPEREVILEAGDAGSPEAVAPPSQLLPSVEGASFSVSLQKPGWVVVSETCYPGWAAFVDGQPAPLRCGDYAFWAVAAPAGEHKVTFRYQPFSFGVGLWVSVVGWVMWILAGARVWYNHVGEFHPRHTQSGIPV